MSRRLRKHANPFTVRTVVDEIDRNEIFGREAPLEVDVGCGEAGLIFDRAKNHPDVDFVGFEVRKAIVDKIEERRQREGTKNVHVFYANANVNLRIAKTGVIRMFHVHFPDPCFKKRHRKRRVLQPDTARIMAELLPIGGTVFAQSDVKPLAEEMYDVLSADGAFESRLGEDLLVASPIDERTEWERHHETNAEPIYRMLFEKVREPSGPIPEIELRDTNPLTVDAEAE